MERSPESVADELAPRLALLAAVRAHGNLTAAAAAVGVPQPTASRWLNGLADTAGVTLVEHVGRRIELTAAGRELAAAATTALQAVTAGTARAVEAADPQRGRVVFAFLHTMGASRVPELLRGFRAEHPGVRFTLQHGGHREMVDMVCAGAVDVALTSPIPVRDAELESTPLFTEPLVLVATAGHRLADRRRVRLSACRAETFVGLKPGYGLRGLTDERCAAAGFTPRPAFEGEDVETVRGLVGAGLGIAVLPARERVPLPGTVELALSPPLHRAVGLVTSTRRPLPPAAATFRDWVAARTRHGAAPHGQ